MSIHRTTAARAVLALTAAALLGACDDGPLQSVPASVPAAQSRAGTGDDVARALAAGLGDPAVRAAVHAALRESPLNEHKLVLAQFMETETGQALVAASAARAGVPPHTLLRWIRGLGETDFYVPFDAHRRGWRAADGVGVGYTANVDDPRLTVYDAGGAARALDARQGTPAQPLLILHPGEPTWTRRGARTVTRGENGPSLDLRIGDGTCDEEVITDNCEYDQESGGDAGDGGGGYTGPLATLTRIRPYAGDWFGDIELMVKHYADSAGVRLVEWISSGYNEGNTYQTSVALPRNGNGGTWIKVWERDSGVLESSGDDFWGQRYMAASGVATVFAAECFAVHGDNPLWRNQCPGVNELEGSLRMVHTIDLTYTY